MSKGKASIDVILLYVLQSKGSSPGRQGFKMAVAADNEIYGTIGGGIMEHKFVEMARAMLKEASVTPAIYTQVHDKQAAKDQSGMICSGEQSIFLYRIQQTDLEHVAALTASLQLNQNGSLQLTPGGISFTDLIPSSDFYFEQKTRTDFLFVEKTGYKNQLHIIGGGHCALALSRVMRQMDFYISLYDERDGLNTVEQNDYVHEKNIVDSYTAVGDIIEAGANVYVVIMTFGYRTDDVALRALLGKKFKYLGVLGSKKKMAEMFEAYRRLQIDEAVLKQIHSPIGIQIKSQTAEEIAISIAAEIIAVKNQ